MKVSIGPYPKKGKRKISVRIDEYDTWNMDHTLAHIIVPMLVQLKKTKHGTPNEMFSEEYSIILGMNDYWVEQKNGPLHKKIVQLEKEAIKKWNDTISKMIKSFKELRSGYKGEEKFYGKRPDRDGYAEYHRKLQEGLTLFGEHYRSLWD